MRSAWHLLAAAAIGGPAGYLAAAATGDALPERVAITARKFDFASREIHVRKGRPVTLVLTTSDFPHGFGIPDFNVRADLVPGRAVEMTFTPNRVGRFVYLCDNFCGEGHGDMTGWLVVTE